MMRVNEEPETWMISRHPGAIEWMETQGVDGTVVDHFDGTVVPGDVYIGTLPIPMIADIIDGGGEFILLVLPTVPFEMRGEELTPAMMDKYGAKLLRIKRIEIEEF